MNPDHQLDIEGARQNMFKNYPPERAKRGMYEMQYYNLHGELPPDAMVIESVEWINGGALIVHYDWQTAKQ